MRWFLHLGLGTIDGTLLGLGGSKIRERVVPRQQCAFSKESSKYAGCEILKRNFYTRFKPENKGFWAVTWWKRCKVKSAISKYYLVIAEKYIAQ